MRRLIGPLSLIIGTTLLLPTGAAAETWKHQDDRRDSIVFDQSGFPIPSRGNRTADLTSISVDYTSKRAVVTIRFRDLTRRTKLVMATIATPDATFDASVAVARRPSKSVFALRRDGIESTSAACADATARVQPRRDRVRIKVPSTCLATPPWLRLGAFAMAEVPNRAAALTDFAMVTGYTSDWFAEEPVLGPQVALD